MILHRRPARLLAFIVLVGHLNITPRQYEALNTIKVSLKKYFGSTEKIQLLKQLKQG